MVPVLVPIVIFEGCVPEQMVWFDDTAPASDGWLTVIIDVSALLQFPFEIVAVKVVVVFGFA